MNGFRDDIAEAVQIEGALVRHHGNIVPNGEPAGDHLFTRRGRVVPQAIDAAVDAGKPSRLGVVGEQAVAEPARTRLCSREVAVLTGGDSKER